MVFDYKTTYTKNQSSPKKSLWAFIVCTVVLITTTACATHTTEEIPPYQRSQWKHWIDADGDCQNTRAEILINDSSAPVTFRKKRHCVVDTGRWYGRYTDSEMSKASALDIDHIVPLKEAHISGGWRWQPEKKQRFANDVINLLPVSKRANRQKGSRDPAQWLPTNTGFICRYLQLWQEVKKQYELEADDLERQATHMLNKQC